MDEGAAESASLAQAQLPLWTDDPRFPGAAARLFEQLADADGERRREVLEYLAQQAGFLSRGRVGRQGVAVYLAGRPRVLELLADPLPGVRCRAAWLLRRSPTDEGSDAEVLAALRGQADAETDPTALATQLLAIAALDGVDDPSKAVEWLRPWLRHSHAQVRLAAVKAVPPDAVGLVEDFGGLAGRAFAAAGLDAPADAPWFRELEAVSRLARRLREHPQAVLRLAGDLFEDSSKDLRRAAVAAAGTQLSHWRHPVAGLWDVVIAALDDEDWVAGEAFTVLSRSGSAAAPWADRLVHFLQQADAQTSAMAIELAVQALVGAEDDRAVPGYRERFGSFHLNVDALPVRWAPELLPAFRERLAEGTGWRGIPEVLRVLSDWGPAAAAALPELVVLLATEHARPAAEALGRIGPAAEQSSELLAELAKGLRRPPDHDGRTWRAPRSWQGRQTAAWAHWRVTGDPGLALSVVGAAARAGLGCPVLRYLADLGPLAAPYADSVRALLTAPGEWTRVGAAEAWWRITGDADTAVGVLLPELRPLDDRQVTPLVLRTVRALGRIGPPAAAAVPALEAVLASERRYGGDIRRDEELCRFAAQALERIHPGDLPAAAQP